LPLDDAELRRRPIFRRQRLAWCVSVTRYL
jgi:hypothetical protein